jgi:sulfocyanin
MLALVLVAGAGRSAGAQASAPAPGSGSNQYVKWDSQTNTATFDLVAGPFKFNDASNGSATFTVPAKANVVINFVNKDGTPHSAMVISGDGPVPNAADEPAIPRAYTNKVQEGLAQEATDVMKFTAPDSGKFRIVCGVPGHALSGMWIWMNVDPKAQEASFGPTHGKTEGR